MNPKDTTQIQFWYDVRDVAGSHAEVTVSIAGLSLAILLILPIFTDNTAAILDKPQTLYALLFFFVSLAYGIFASFAYSVSSGDARPEGDRLLAFLGPSVSFGVSGPSLFLGFIYVVDAYLSDSKNLLFVLDIMRLFLLAAVWTSGIFVSRTILEVLRFNVDIANRYTKTREDLHSKIIWLFIAIYSIPTIAGKVMRSLVYMITSEGLIMRYFQFLVVLCIVNVIYYAFVTRSDMSTEFESAKVRKKNVRNLKLTTYTLLILFNVFIFWTLIAFV